MTIVNKQRQKGFNIQRANRLRYKEVKPTGRLPIIHTHHHPSFESVNKTINNEFKNYSRLTLCRHPFDITVIFAYRQPQKFSKIQIKSKLLYTATSTGIK